MRALHFNIETIKGKLNTLILNDLTHQFSNYACVAILIREIKTGNQNDIEIGFIKRAEDPNDHWSGHLAFPGGKKDPEDTTDLSTILRELSEEVGINLTAEKCLGQLNDIQAQKRGERLPFFIRPFVFMANDIEPGYLQTDEVAEFYWIKFSHLINPDNETTYNYKFENGQLKLPGILFPNGLILWGLTYLMFLDLKNLFK